MQHFPLRWIFFLMFSCVTIQFTVHLLWIDLAAENTGIRKSLLQKNVSQSLSTSLGRNTLSHSLLTFWKIWLYIPVNALTCKNILGFVAIWSNNFKLGIHFDFQVNVSSFVKRHCIRQLKIGDRPTMIWFHQLTKPS